MTSDNNFTKYTQVSLHTKGKLCCDCLSQPRAFARTDGRCYYCGKLKDGLIKSDSKQFNTQMRDKFRRLGST